MVKSVKLKLKGGIILPEKGILTKEKINEIKEKTRDAIVEGYKTYKLDKALGDDNADISQILAELGDTGNSSSKLDKALFAQTKKGQKEITAKQEKALEAIEKKIEGDPKNPAVKGIRQLIDDSIATGKATGSDIKTLETLLKSVGVDAKDSKTLLDLIQFTTSAVNQPRSAQLQQLKNKLPNLAIWKNLNVLKTLTDDVNLSPVTGKDINDLLDLVRTINNTPEEISIFGKPDPTNTKYWKFKDVYYPKLDKIMMDKQTKIGQKQAADADLVTKKGEKKVKTDTIDTYKKDVSSKKKAKDDDKKQFLLQETQNMSAKIQLISNDLKGLSEYISDSKKGVNSKYEELINIQQGMTAKNAIDKVLKAQNILNQINSYVSKYRKNLSAAFKKLSAVNRGGKSIDIEIDGNQYSIPTFKAYISNSNGALADEINKLKGNINTKPFDDEIDNLTKAEQAFLADPANDPLAYDKDIANLEALMTQLTGDENALDAAEQNELQQGFGLKRKGRGKLSKLDNVTLDDISKAIFEQIKKKRGDKRRKGNNQYHHFQKRSNGKFTGGIISSAQEVEDRIMEVVAAGQITQAIKMLQASKDVFSKSDYDRIMLKVTKFY